MERGRIGAGVEALIKVDRAAAHRAYCTALWLRSEAGAWDAFVLSHRALRTLVLTLYPLEKGVSRNPGGRPKGDATVKDLARAHTVEAIETLVAMLQAESERTRVAAAEALLSRGWGTPTAHIETGPPGSFAEALDAVKLRAQSDN